LKQSTSNKLVKQVDRQV